MYDFRCSSCANRMERPRELRRADALASRSCSRVHGSRAGCRDDELIFNYLYVLLSASSPCNRLFGSRAECLDDKVSRRGGSCTAIPWLRVQESTSNCKPRWDGILAGKKKDEGVASRSLEVKGYRMSGSSEETTGVSNKCSGGWLKMKMRRGRNLSSSG
jgi:hypothetical protein